MLDSMEFKRVIKGGDYSKRMKKFAIILSALILLGCTHPTTKSHVGVNATNVTPNEIMGMRKLVCVTGKPALEMVKEMHIGKIRYVKDIALMHYIGNNSSKFVMVWVTVYPNSSVAMEETRRMAKAMIDFGWKDVKTMKVGDLTVYYVIPPGKNETHYFWCRDSVMIYIIPKGLNETQVKEFIRKL